MAARDQRPPRGVEQWQRPRRRTAVGLCDRIGTLSHRLATGEMDQRPDAVRERAKDEKRGRGRVG